MKGIPVPVRRKSRVEGLRVGAAGWLEFLMMRGRKPEMKSGKISGGKTS